MGKRREQKPLSPRVEPPLAFDEEDEEEPPPRYASRTELDDDEEGCSWNQVRAAGLGAMLILFVIVVAVLPAPKNATFSKLLLKRSKPKPLWPPPGHEVPGCNPVGNASKGQPVARQSRVFLLQRDERKNLADMINYHRQVLAPDQIVILDHRSDDSLTRRVLSRFNAAGGHVWKCERDFAQHRADMMSAVMRLYAPYSTFLVPLEADEMLAVAARGGGLAWSAPELSGALASLPEPKALFKLRTTAGVPHDCPDMPQEEQASRAAEVATEGLVAEKCLGAAKPLEPFSCGSRTFYRGAEFVGTGAQNVIGATSARPDAMANAGQCQRGGLDPMYGKSSLVVVHFQVGSLNDLMLRVMRQAARLSPARCNQRDRPHVSSEVKELQMYCAWHAIISKAELNLSAIRPRYERAYCAPPERLVSLQDALRQACFPASAEKSIVSAPGI